jgi:hypothetical protein
MTNLSFDVPIYVMEKELHHACDSLAKVGWNTSTVGEGWTRRTLYIEHEEDLSGDEILTTGILIGQCLTRTS